MPFQPAEMTEATLRRLVDNLVRQLKVHPLPASPKRSQLQETLAATLGWPSYHAAITELKRKPLGEGFQTHALPATADWLLSAGPFKSLNLPKEWASETVRVSGTDVFSVPTERFACSVLLKASEHDRRQTVDAVLSLNPRRPVCVVKGPMSILRPLPFAEQVLEKHVAELLTSGTAAQITDMVLGPMASSSGDNALWHGRSASLLSAVIAVLVCLRDQSGFVLNVDAIAEHVSLVGVESLTQPNHAKLPPHLLQALKAYLRSLPGYDAMKENQGEVTKEQHGYVQMLLSPLIARIRSNEKLVLHKQKPQKEGGVCLEVVLPERDLSGVEWELVKRNVQSWVDRNQGGLLVFDVPPPGRAWPWMTNQLSHWLDQGQAVWVGVASEGDIPTEVLRTLLPRLGQQKSVA